MKIVVENNDNKVCFGSLPVGSVCRLSDGTKFIVMKIRTINNSINAIILSNGDHDSIAHSEMVELASVAELKLKF